MLTPIDDAREILADLADEAGVPPVVFVSAAVGAYGGMGSGAFMR